MQIVSSIATNVNPDTINNTPIPEKEIKANNTLAKDTASAAPLNQESEKVESKATESKEKKKNKVKRPLNLTPSSNFLPVNKNF